MGTLTITDVDTTDFIGHDDLLNDVTAIVFDATNTSDITVRFDGAQLGNLIADNVSITGNGNFNNISIVMTGAGTVSAANWSFTNWTGGVDFTGSGGADTITGSANPGGNLIVGGDGADILTGGAGPDVFRYNFPGEVVAGDPSTAPGIRRYSGRVCRRDL
ncbi:MAG: hypothetical protein R3D30_11685 [Hyphomicrobiales bacterium]